MRETQPDKTSDQFSAPRAVHSLGLIFFPAFDWAISPSHPEREERLLYTQDQLREEGLFDIPGISEHRPELADFSDISRVHFCPPGFARVAEVPHLASAGSAISAGHLVLSGTCDKSFALTRPPGHHAMKVVQGGRGFCAVNIEAVMLERLRKDYGVRRVAIVDTDCHHGDGSQDVYWHDPDTLYISLHQDGRTLYPGSGFSNELGGPQALGATINIPLPPRTGDAGFLLASKEIVKPVLDAWKPELIINSAGQDNHFSDPITDMHLSARGYAEMVKTINPDIAVLEGGYSIQGALPYVNLAVILALAGMDFSRVIEPAWREDLAATSPDCMDYIGRLRDKTLEIFQRPGQSATGYRREKGGFVRERDIYYDTDGISEQQSENLRDCPNCPGLLIIRTRTSYSDWTICIHIPRSACPACAAAGEDRKREAERKHEAWEFSDQRNDIYLRG
ncbi:MAG: histone deacetylase [Desulfovibrio sp.]|jgi:acetoin utilization deacetylase AcuC-like enzyme|nr:histone deacetylase [Desulfovibrio sp.]